jgi:hypothetical protein
MTTSPCTVDATSAGAVPAGHPIDLGANLDRRRGVAGGRRRSDHRTDRERPWNGPTGAEEWTPISDETVAARTLQSIAQTVATRDARQEEDRDFTRSSCANTRLPLTARIEDGESIEPFAVRILALRRAPQTRGHRDVLTAPSGTTWVELTVAVTNTGSEPIATWSHLFVVAEDRWYRQVPIADVADFLVDAQPGERDVAGVLLFRIPSRVADDPLTVVAASRAVDRSSLDGPILSGACARVQAQAVTRVGDSPLVTNERLVRRP